MSLPLPKHRIGTPTNPVFKDFRMKKIRWWERLALIFCPGYYGIPEGHTGPVVYIKKLGSRFYILKEFQ